MHNHPRIVPSVFASWAYGQWFIPCWLSRMYILLVALFHCHFSAWDVFVCCESSYRANRQFPGCETTYLSVKSH